MRYASDQRPLLKQNDEKRGHADVCCTVNFISGSFSTAMMLDLSLFSEEQSCPRDSSIKKNLDIPLPLHSSSLWSKLSIMHVEMEGLTVSIKSKRHNVESNP